MRLANRTAIVTGGASGIGRGVAVALAEEGADVAIGDVQREPKSTADRTPTTERVRSAGRTALFVETDVSDPDDARTLVERATDELGGIDVVVNNAGVALGGSIETVPRADWDRTFAVNVTGVRNVSRHALPELRNSDAGRIINMASQLGLVARRESAAYCASKAAIINLTRQMALDYASEGITVNAISPGIIQVRAEMSDERRARLDSHTPLPVVGRPEDVGRAAVFLASRDGRYVTGHNLVVDGGYTAH